MSWKLAWLVGIVVGCNGSDTDDGGTEPVGDDDDDTVVGDDDDDTVVGDDDDDTVIDDAVHTFSSRLHDIRSMAYVTWTLERQATVHVEFSFDPGVWVSTPSRTLEPGTYEQLLVGIPFGYTADWQVVLEDDGSVWPGGSVTTGNRPPVPDAVVNVSEEKGWLPGANYLVTSVNENTGGWTGGDYWTIILDRQGRLVWASLAPDSHWTLFVTIARTGDHLLWDEATYWSSFPGDEGAGSRVHRTWLDEEIEVIPTPGLHHAFVELPDGTLVWGSQDHGGGEALVEKAPGQTDETVLWTCSEDWPGSLPCESNGLFYVESTDSFLYSFYTNNSVVEVDRATGTSLWWAGQVNGGYDFDPPQSEFYWQHGVSYTDAGTLLLSSWQDDDLTWAMEYEVDRTNGVLNYVWGSNAEVHADTNGQAWRLDNGNTLHVVGSAGVLRETDPKGVDVWRVTFGGTHLLGNAHFIEDLYTLTKPVD